MCRWTSNKVREQGRDEKQEDYHTTRNDERKDKKTTCICCLCNQYNENTMQKKGLLLKRSQKLIFVMLFSATLLICMYDMCTMSLVVTLCYICLIDPLYWLIHKHLWMLIFVITLYTSFATIIQQCGRLLLGHDVNNEFRVP